MSETAQPIAAAPKSDFRTQIVFAAGSGTTLLALAGVAAAAHAGENILGWYANYIIPVGAILVGMVAASGYGLAAWQSGLKMNARLTWIVVAELTASYLVAQYEEFRFMVPEDSPLGFWEWFDAMSRGFAWKQSNGQLGEPMGLLGYGLRVLEIAGYAFGGAMVPIILRSKPYCDPCRIYKRTRNLAALPAASSMESANEGLQAILTAAISGSRAKLEEEVAARGPLTKVRQVRKTKAHVMVHLVRCPRCSAGSLEASLVVGQGQNVRATKLQALPLAAERVRELFG